LNQNNRNNNRRRGRGGNRGQGGGGQSNRIDSRARGNAPQLLEKYKKLAHDAALNGDRVQTEYYLQFADHYFRVVADSRVQRDDPRPRRDHDRDPREQGYDDPEDFEEAEEADRGSDRGRAPARRQPDEDRESDREGRRDERPAAGEGERGSEGDEAAAGDDNPFTRDTRSRRPRGGRGKPAADKPAADKPGEAAGEGESGFDPGVLPPSIAREEGTPAPRRARTRKPRPVDDGDAEALEAVS